MVTGWYILIPGGWLLLFSACLSRSVYLPGAYFELLWRRGLICAQTNEAGASSIPESLTVEPELVSWALWEVL